MLLSVFSVPPPLCSLCNFPLLLPAFIPNFLQFSTGAFAFLLYGIGMSKRSFNGPPSPEDFQRQMTDFMRQHFPNATSFFRPQTGNDSTEPPSSTEPTKPGEFRFDKKPRDVKDYLDRFVIKQDDAKKVLSVAMCDHYHHVRLAMEGKDQP